MAVVCNHGDYLFLHSPALSHKNMTTQKWTVFHLQSGRNVHIEQQCYNVCVELQGNLVSGCASFRLIAHSEKNLRESSFHYSFSQKAFCSLNLSNP